MKFQQIRGATVKINFSGKTFLIDPFLAPKDNYPPLPMCHFPDKRWPTADLPLSIQSITDGIDAVILTHLHPDHWDGFAAAALSKNIQLFTQDEIDAQTVREQGFSNVDILSASGTKFADITMFAIECLHGHPETTQKYYDISGLREKAVGIVFTSDKEQNFYLAGDTIWYQAVDTAIKQYQPQIIALNAADAQFTDSGSIIMGLNDIKQVCSAAPKAKVILTHLDAVPHAMLGRKEIKKFIEDNRLQNQAIVPDDGEILQF